MYDGDGKRVKSIINPSTGSGQAAITTYFVGAHYEVTGSTITKYYYAGAQRIAMRSNGTLSYLLGDHLGSTSLTTDAAGNKVSEIRYKAWGTVRYATENVPTKYQYTGQYSYEAEFGLYFYNARWYDPVLSRFAQADTIVPSGVQGYDRYAYVNNNPILYIDPSGHRPCGDEEAISCSGKRNGISLSDEERKKQSIKARYSVEIFGPWTLEGLTNLQASLDALASSMGGASQLNYWIAEASSGDKINFFYDIRGGLNNNAACGAHACWDSSGKYGLKDSIRVDDYAMSDDYLKIYLGRDPLRRPPGLGLQDQNSSKQVTLVHEMVHMLQTANPNALTAYNQEYANDPRMNDFGNTPSESMATSLAIYAVSGGASYPGYGKHTMVAQTIFNNYFVP